MLTPEEQIDLASELWAIAQAPTTEIGIEGVIRIMMPVIAAYTAAVEDKERERCVAEAKRIKDIIAEKYQDRIDTKTSDMTSNSDWMRLEGAVSVVEAIRSLK